MPLTSFSFLPIRSAIALLPCPAATSCSTVSWSSLTDARPTPTVWPALLSPPRLSCVTVPTAGSDGRIPAGSVWRHLLYQTPVGCRQDSSGHTKECGADGPARTHL